MFGYVFAAVAVLLAVGAHRAPREPDVAAVRRTLLVFAACALATRTLVRLALPHAPWLLVPAALLGLAAWGGLIRLSACGTKRGDLVGRALFGIPAVLTALAGSVQAPAVLTLLVTEKSEWTRRFRSRTLFGLALGGLALLPLVLWTGDSRGRALTGLPADAFACVRWAMIVGEFYLGYGVVALLGAFVRDPSLGIRTAGRRLALSHVLVAAIPLALIGGLWSFTTVLGVNNDHALIATRLLEGEGRRWERRLAERLAAGGPWTAAAADSATWPRGARLWVGRDGTFERVRGEALAGEERLKAWADSLPWEPRSGFVKLDGALWFGAAAAESARGASAVLLFPATVVLEGEAARVAGARLSAPLNVRGEGGAFVVGGGSPTGRATPGERRRGAPATDSATARADSLALDRVRGVTRRLGIPDSVVRSDRPRRGGVRLTTPEDTLEVSSAGPFRPSVLLDGYALAPALEFEKGRWIQRQALIAASVPPGEVLAGLYRSVRENPLGMLPLVLIAFVTGLVVLVVAFDFTMVTNMGRSITGAIGALRGGAARLEAGDLGHRIELKGDDDLWATAAAFNQALAGLERARALEQERARLESELALARQIQARLLPAGPPRVGGFEIAGLSESARQVGGDYYDHIAVDSHRVLLVIADVSGKGVPAALLMSGFRASLMSQNLRAWDPVALAAHLNDFLVRSVESGKFVTAFLGFADAAAGTLDYVNAGHNPPVLWRGDGTHDLLTEGGVMLGIMPGAPFAAGHTRFAPGDLLVLYTDGVTEGANAAGEMWGDERLIETLARERLRPPAELAREIATRVRAFEGEQGPADDVTLLIARRTDATR